MHAEDQAKHLNLLDIFCRSAKSLFLLAFSPRVLSVNFLFCSFVFRRRFSNDFKRLGGEGCVLFVLSRRRC